MLGWGYRMVVPITSRFHNVRANTRCHLFFDVPETKMCGISALDGTNLIYIHAHWRAFYTKNQIFKLFGTFRCSPWPTYYLCIKYTGEASMPILRHKTVSETLHCFCVINRLIRNGWLRATSTRSCGFASQSVRILLPGIFIHVGSATAPLQAYSLQIMFGERPWTYQRFMLQSLHVCILLNVIQSNRVTVN